MLDFLIESGLAASRNEARRVLLQGAVHLNGRRVGESEPAPQSGDLVRVGRTRCAVARGFR